MVTDLDVTVGEGEDRVRCRTRDISEGGLFIFWWPAPPEGETFPVDIEALTGTFQVTARVSHAIDDVGVAVEVVGGDLAAYQRLVRTLTPAVMRESVVEAISSPPSSVDDGAVHVTRRPSTAPPPLPQGSVLDNLTSAWTPLNATVVRHLSKLVQDAFTEERVYEVDGEERAIKFLQTIELSVLDPDTLDEVSGVPLYDGQRLALLPTGADHADRAGIRHLTNADLVQIKGREPCSWRELFEGKSPL